jgi:hypothetical protein
LRRVNGYTGRPGSDVLWHCVVIKMMRYGTMERQLDERWESRRGGEKEEWSHKIEIDMESDKGSRVELLFMRCPSIVCHLVPLQAEQLSATFLSVPHPPHIMFVLAKKRYRTCRYLGGMSEIRPERRTICRRPINESDCNLASLDVSWMYRETSESDLPVKPLSVHARENIWLQVSMGKPSIVRK